MQRFLRTPAKDGTHSHHITYEAPATEPRPVIPADATCSICGMTMAAINQEQAAP